MTISLPILRALEARFDGPIPPEDRRALDGTRPSAAMAQALSLREHHRCHAAAALRAVRRGRGGGRDDLDFHRRQFQRWNRRVWALRSAEREDRA